MAHSNANEGDPFFVGVVCLLVGAFLLVPGLLARWARWLPRRTATPLSVTRAVYVMLALGLGGPLLIPPGTAVHTLFAVFAPPVPSDASGDHARIVARAISESFFKGAFVWLGAVGLATLWLLYATWRYHWSVVPPVPIPEPPYR
jgi:hypothetical protein